jgi:hypothetical protein
MITECDDVIGLKLGKLEDHIHPNIRIIMATEVSGSVPAGAVYALGLIGAAVYFISTATGFWMGLLGVIKALVWPAILIFDAFKALGV